jgi:hypothetical protein
MSFLGLTESSVDTLKLNGAGTLPEGIFGLLWPALDT